MTPGKCIFMIKCMIGISRKFFSKLIFFSSVDKKVTFYKRQNYSNFILFEWIEILKNLSGPWFNLSAFQNATPNITRKDLLDKTGRPCSRGQLITQPSEFRYKIVPIGMVFVWYNLLYRIRISLVRENCFWFHLG